MKNLFLFNGVSSTFYFENREYTVQDFKRLLANQVTAESDPVANFNQARQRLCYAFVEKYFIDEDLKLEDVDIQDHGAFYEVQDYTFSLFDMETAIVHNIPEDILFSWYHKNLDADMESKSFSNLVNYYKYFSGFKTKERTNEAT